MKYSLIFILFLFSMCNNKKTSKNIFEGSYKGNHSGIVSSAELTVAGRQLNGEVTLNGKKASIDGTVNGSSTVGTMKDAETGQFYDFTGSISGDELRFSVTSPEDNNQKVELVLYRESPSRESTSSDDNSARRKSSGASKERNADLVGLWKNTEVLGGGDMSFSTENFIELNEDGTMRSWTGRSAGAGTSMESDEANASRAEWYTDGNKLIFVDPSTQQDATTLYSVSESGLLLHNGGAEKKIFERVR